MPIPRVVSARGVELDADGVLLEPNTCTWATPLIVEMRWAMLVCAYSSTV